MTKIDIISGFLGAGKTTLIQKLLKEALAGSQVVLIENEFGEIGIDGGFLKESGIQIREMNSGCICCSLVGDFGASLKEVLSTYHPERILIEPSGVGKLSDVMKAVQDAGLGTEVELNSAVAVVDAAKCKMYLKNFGEFFVNQIEYAGTILLSRTDVASAEKVRQAMELIREHNPKATVITTPLAQLDGKDVLATIEGATDLETELMEQVKAMHEEHDHHHECGHEDHDHHHECGHEEHHHHHGEDCTCGCHDHDHHHHDHDHHHDHGHHHADEVFASWGFETPDSYTEEEIRERLDALSREETYGMILRAKGMVPSEDGRWIYFDYVPGESDVRSGRPDVIGKVCVIGSKIREDALEQLFRK